ncbi:MAG: hypothetical protein QNJ53_21960 [Pleurocapsa sp. MO_192.B19]|nr:hypothetical protein [Pleurocapsa sp. MO_192.B19]
MSPSLSVTVTTVVVAGIANSALTKPVSHLLLSLLRILCRVF